MTTHRYYPSCPCNKCICIAICRLKTYTKLIVDCTLINSYLVQPGVQGNLYNVMTALDPTIWEVGRYNSKRSFVSERKD